MLAVAVVYAWLPSMLMSSEADVPGDASLIRNLEPSLLPRRKVYVPLPKQ